MTEPVDITYLTRWAENLERASVDPMYTVTPLVAEDMKEKADHLRRAIAALTEKGAA